MRIPGPWPMAVCNAALFFFNRQSPLQNDDGPHVPHLQLPVRQERGRHGHEVLVTLRQRHRQRRGLVERHCECPRVLADGDVGHQVRGPFEVVLQLAHAPRKVQRGQKVAVFGREMDEMHGLEGKEHRKKVLYPVNEWQSSLHAGMKIQARADRCERCSAEIRRAQSKNHLDAQIGFARKTIACTPLGLRAANPFFGVEKGDAWTRFPWGRDGDPQI